jgi:hypothetical protein
VQARGWQIGDPNVRPTLIDNNPGAFDMKTILIPVVALAFALCAADAFAQTARENDVSPRIGHIHVTVDDARWHWADTSGAPLIINCLPAGHRS